MEINLPTLCYNCSKPLPSVGYFCGACLIQFKCKSCDAILEKDYVGCVNCGTPKLNVERNTTSQHNINTFRLHETATDRTIEASFSDDVAKDIAGTLRDAAAVNRMRVITSSIPSSDDFSEKTEDTVQFAEAEITYDGNDAPKTVVIPASKTVSNNAKTEGYPAMRHLVMNTIPSSEVEWVIVYAFYSSNFGENPFTRKDIMNQYEESGRKTVQRFNNLTGSITNAVKGNYSTPINNEDFSIANKGIEKAKEIISRTSGSSQKIRSSSKAKKGNGDDENKMTKGKKSSNAIKSYKKLPDINFYPSEQKSLLDFIKDYKIKNDSERNLLFTYYLSEILKITPITLSHLYTCYDEVNHKIPENMVKSLDNTKYRTSWLETKNSNIEITTRGLNKIKFWDKK